jgi:hypothetical protein
MKRQLIYRLGKKLGIRLIGEFEIAVKPSMKGQLHLHAWAIHPGVTQADMESVLRKVFPASRAVLVQSPYRNEKTLDENVLTAAEYAAKIDIKVTGQGFNTPEVLINLLASLESIRSGGHRGLRFQIGFSKRRRQTEEDSALTGSLIVGDPDRQLEDHVFPLSECIDTGTLYRHLLGGRSGEMRQI